MYTNTISMYAVSCVDIRNRWLNKKALFIKIWILSFVQNLYKTVTNSCKASLYHKWEFKKVDSYTHNSLENITGCLILVNY